MFFLDRAFQLLLHRDRLRQAGAGDAQCLDREITLVQAGHELAAHARGQQSGQDHCNSHKGQHDRLVCHHSMEHRCIDAFGALHQNVFFFGDLVADEQRHRGRDEGNGQDHRAE